MGFCIYSHLDAFTTITLIQAYDTSAPNYYNGLQANGPFLSSFHCNFCNIRVRYWPHSFKSCFLCLLNRLVVDFSFMALIFHLHTPYALNLQFENYLRPNLCFHSFLLIQFYWNIANSIHLHLVCGYLHSKMAELSSSDSECMACKATHICSLALYRKMFADSFSRSVLLQV